MFCIFVRCKRRPEKGHMTSSENPSALLIITIHIALVEAGSHRQNRVIFPSYCLASPRHNYLPRSSSNTHTHHSSTHRLAQADWVWPRTTCRTDPHHWSDRGQCPLRRCRADDRYTRPGSRLHPFVRSVSQLGQSSCQMHLNPRRAAEATSEHNCSSSPTASLNQR